MKKLVFIFIICLLTKSIFAYQTNKPNQFLQLRDLLNLIKQAKLAGFNIEQTNKLIIYNGNEQLIIEQVHEGIIEIENRISVDPKLLEHRVVLKFESGVIYLNNLILELVSEKTSTMIKYLSASDVNYQSMLNQKTILDSIANSIK